MGAVDLKPHTKKLGGNDYVMVSGRVLLAHADNPEAISIETELLSWNEAAVVVRAVVTTRRGTYTGLAASYLASGSPQERKTPLEVAETSAIGRALGFAGYAIEGGIASADEMERADGGHGNGSQAEANRQKVDARRAEYVQNDAAEAHDAEIALSKAEAKRLHLSKDLLFAAFEALTGKDLADANNISLQERRDFNAKLRGFRDRDAALDWLDRETNKPPDQPEQAPDQDEDPDFAPLQASHEDYMKSAEELTAALEKTSRQNIAAQGRRIATP